MEWCSAAITAWLKILEQRKAKTMKNSKSLVQVTAILILPGDLIGSWVDDEYMIFDDFGKVTKTNPEKQSPPQKKDEWVLEKVDSNCLGDDLIATSRFWMFYFKPIGDWNMCPWNSGFEMEFDAVGRDFIEPDSDSLIKISDSLAAKEPEIREFVFVTAWSSSQQMTSSSYYDDPEPEHICELIGIVDLDKIQAEPLP